MSKLALIADGAVLPALALSGVKVFAGQTAESFSNALSDISADGGYKMIFVTEDAAEKNPEEIEKAAFMGLSLTVIPGHGKKSGIFDTILDNLTTKATGAG